MEGVPDMFYSLRSRVLPLLSVLCLAAPLAHAQDFETLKALALMGDAEAQFEVGLIYLSLIHI